MKAPALVAPFFGLVLLAAVPSHALEPMVLYDNFNDGAIDATRWGLLTLFTREVTKDRLRLMGQAYGLTGTDTGVSSTGVNSVLEGAAPGGAVKSMRATLRVSSISAERCLNNTSPSNSRARLVASLFNVGTPVPGSQTGDVYAQIFLRRFSNSSDDPGVMRVSASLDQCTDSACGASTRLGSAEFGTATLNQAVTLQMRWDPAGDQVLFSRDGGAATAVPYAVSDSAPPGAPLKNASVRFSVANCTLLPRPSGQIEATFDNVYVNESAMPP